TATAGLGGIGAVVQSTVLRKLRQRVDVGADVRAHGDEVVGGGSAVRPHHVALPPGRRVPVGRMVGGLRHPDGERAPEVVAADAPTDRLKEGIYPRVDGGGAGHVYLSSRE